MKKRRGLIYIGLALALFAGYGALRGVVWEGSTNLHTLMEVAATLLALFVGAMALVRFYTRKTNLFLLIGTGFVGTALLDGYHALVTSAFFAARMAILDWMMPGMDGVEVCRKLRRMSDSRLLYILLLTAKGRQEDIVAGLEAGGRRRDSRRR